jgi:hypothetical protein
MLSGHIGSSASALALLGRWGIEIYARIRLCRYARLDSLRLSSEADSPISLAIVSEEVENFTGKY